MVAPAVAPAVAVGAEAGAGEPVKALLITKVHAAKLALAEAETNLERAMSELSSAPRWQKVTISESLEYAFATLRSAKVELAELEALISRSETESSPERP